MHRLPNLSMKVHLCSGKLCYCFHTWNSCAINSLSPLSVRINLPQDQACSLLLKPAIRCASNGMFTSLLAQSCRQVSPTDALLSANMYVNNQAVNSYLFRLNGEEATWSDGFLLGDLWVAAALPGQSNLCETSLGLICNCSISYNCTEGMRRGKRTGFSLLWIFSKHSEYLLIPTRWFCSVLLTLRGQRSILLL